MTALHWSRLGMTLMLVKTWGTAKGEKEPLGMKWEQKNTGLPLLSVKFCKFPSFAGGPEARWALARTEDGPKARAKHRKATLVGSVVEGTVLLGSLARRLRPQRGVLVAFPSVLLQLGWVSARQALLEHSHLNSHWPPVKEEGWVCTSSTRLRFRLILCPC